MIFYFSGTGNSRWVAERLAREQNETLYFIPHCIRDKNYSFSLRNNEKIGFVFPIYSWGPPLIVLQFIKQLQVISYQGQYLFFVCSCGDDIGLTQNVFVDAISRKGWKCDAGFSVIMPNNYVLLPGFDVDPDDVRRKKLTEAVDRVQLVSHSICCEAHLFDCNEGRFPYLKTRVINPLFNKFPTNPKKFHAADSCVGCGRCVKACPIQNVKLVDRKPEWGSYCTSCLACYHVCPEHAVQYGKVTQKKGRYFNPSQG